MQTNTEQTEQLWKKFLANEATPAEVDRLFEYIDATHDMPGQWDFVAEGFAVENEALPGFIAMEEDQKIRLLQQWKALHSERKPGVIRRLGILRRWSWAAAVVVIVLAGVLWMRQQRRPERETVVLAAAIEPGKNGAVLTLADGRQIVLDSAGGGIIAMQNGTEVLLKGGELVYQPTGKDETAAVFNTVHTPRGGQFQLMLPDGTKVWLNSASSIRYPTAFTGKDRKVEVTGEAYFEVAQKARLPFIALVPGKQEVEVLGTEFNINAYDNGTAVRTTLIQGAVRVNNKQTVTPRQGIVLQPGQQAVLTAQERMMVLNKVDTYKVTAWKNGIFNFDGMSLREAMQQLERWYDIEVVYENGVPEIPFAGEMSRKVSLDGLLKMLAGADLSFRIEENRRKLIITK